MASPRSFRSTIGAHASRTPTPVRTAPTRGSSDSVQLLRRVGNRALGAYLQAKLRVGPADDHYEREADATATAVMRSAAPHASRDVTPIGYALQRCACGGTCSTCRSGDHDDTKVQTSSIDGGGASFVSPDVESRLESTRGRGAALPEYSRSFMESRFGRDFSGVRVHTGGHAESLSHDLNAHAFTSGTDIYFGAGQYRPGTSAGDHLLAHELTHVVQQNPGIRRAPARDALLGHAAATHLQRDVIQRAPFFFAPPSLRKGNDVHDDTLPLFLTSQNAGLFIEAPIPGAKKNWWDISPDAQGRGDFYMGTDAAGKSRTIGVKMKENVPEFMTPWPKNALRWQGGAYDHDKTSAPQGPQGTGLHVPTGLPKAASTPGQVRSISAGPTTVRVGDLKPGYSVEEVLGRGQVNDYLSGVDNTAASLNTYIKANPKQSDEYHGSGAPPTWSPKTSALDNLVIPADIAYPGGTHFRHTPLSLWDSGFASPKKVHDTSMTGRMYVYQSTIAGLYCYEWIPDNPSAHQVSDRAREVLNRLNVNVIPAITTSPDDGTLPRKAKSAAPLVAPARPKTVVVQRKFSDEQWQTTHYKPWKTDADAYLGDKNEMQQAEVARTLVHIEERSGKNIGLPDAVKAQGTGIDKIKHWDRWGGIYGWLREKFDFIFVKFQKMSKWVKDKVAKLMKSKAATSFGGWAKAVAQVIFKIFKMLASWTIRSVVDKLVHSLTQGITNNLKKLVEMATPDGVKGKLGEFEALKEKYNEIVEKKEEEISTFLFGDHLALFEAIEEFETIAKTAADIETLVEWGVRLIACASPPAIGCLWNLAISALQYAFSLLMQTCWFTRKVYKPVIDKVDRVRNFPTKVAGEVVKVANDYIPYPKGFDPWFAAITQPVDGFDPDCKDSGDGPGATLSPEREALLELVQDPLVGPAKLELMLQVANDRGAGPWVLMDVDRIKAVREALATVQLDQLKDVAKDKSKTVPVPLEAFMKDIAKYTKKETTTAKEFFEQRDKARKEAAARKAAAGKGDQSTPTGSGPAAQVGSGTASKGSTQGGTAAAPVTVLDARDHKLDPTVKRLTPNPRIYAKVVGGSKEHGRKHPDVVGADIFVDGVQRYRVQNIRVRGVSGGYLLVANGNVFEIVYYLEDGLQLNIDGQDVYWEQLQWAVFEP